MKRVKREFQRSIRIGGRHVKSPKFLTLREANAWYNEKLAVKLAVKSGLTRALGAGPTLSRYFHDTWIVKRKKKYDEPTWAPDMQRFKKYIEKSIGNIKLSKLNKSQVKACLESVVDEHGMSSETRDRVQALLSVIFKGAINEKPQLMSENLTRELEFDEARQGKKRPDAVRHESELGLILRAAGDLSINHLLACAIPIMSGLRKSEIIPLTFNDVDFLSKSIDVNKRYIQATKKIKLGTKAGEDEGREVSIPDDLIKIINKAREMRPEAAGTDFILVDGDGNCIKPRAINNLLGQVGEIVGLKLYPHKLRHTYGRFYVRRGGNKKNLQANLGHSSSATTDHYSNLAGMQSDEDRNIMNIEVDDE